jgi:RNA polymerase sigma factor (sigma-70 family)
LPLLETTLGLIKVVKKDIQQNSESQNSNSLTQQKNSKQLKTSQDTSKQKELTEDALIREHYGLVVSQALYFLDDSNFEDYIQAGLIGLLKSIRTYVEEKSKFSTYASICIKNEIHKLKKKLNRLSATNKIEEFEIQFRYNTKESILDYLPESFPEEYKFIIKLRLQGYTNKEISEYTLNTKNEVSDKISLIIQMLRDVNS